MFDDPDRGNLKLVTSRNVTTLASSCIRPVRIAESDDPLPPLICAITCRWSVMN